MLCLVSICILNQRCRCICQLSQNFYQLTVSTFMEFCYLVRRSVISDNTQIQDALKRYHKYREVFCLTGVCPNGFSSLPCQHSIDHYVAHTHSFSAPNSVCSSITESKHIKAIKEAWQKSNCHQPLRQMLLCNQ